VRILVFHGYLLHGTGSNVYNANLAAALAGLGHEVHLLCQDRAPEELGFVDAAGDWDDGGELRVRTLREPVRCTVYRPALAGLLPVYVADRYEGIEARPFQDCSAAEVEAYVAANVRAVQEVVARVAPDIALANHLVMGPLVLARALGGAGIPPGCVIAGSRTKYATPAASLPDGRRHPPEHRRTAIPYAVKVHGSALEYTVKPHPRFLPAAREGIASARAVLVGSRHVAESLWAALGDPELPARTRLGPPGVDVARFTPRAPQEALDRLAALAARLAAQATPSAAGRSGPAASPASPAGAPGAAAARDAAATGEPSAFARDAGEAAAALASVAEGASRGDRLVAFVGKLIVSKGVDLLLAAWPLVLAAEPRARLVVVGFGAYREAFERLLAALAGGDLDAVAALAAEGRAAEGGPCEPLKLLQAFLAGLEGDERAGYLEAARGLRERVALTSLDGDERAGYPDPARGLRERVVLTGRLDHDELADLLPACEALVVPSTFPEAFGMVAAEAAACGALPVCAEHSGLAEVAGALAEAVPPEAAPWLAFRTSAAPGDGADAPDPVRAIAQRLVAWLAAPAPLRAATRDAIVATVRERWSWEGVARGVVAAAQGRLGELPQPAPLDVP
jgi:glycosyltransferase involved in cell wall biosynthesis